MSNTWKARCVWINEDETEWDIGDIIEVENGMGIASGNYSHGFGEMEDDCLQSFDKWCEFQEEEYTRWELISEKKSTLRDHIKMKQAKIILARYKKGIMSKEQVLNYLAVCGMNADIKMYILNNL